MRKRNRFALLGASLMAVMAIAVTSCSGAVQVPNPTVAGKVKIKYGPFNVPDKNSPGTSPFAGFMPMLGAQLENGMIWNQPVKNVKKPCDNCYITGMVAGLEYENGTNANINNGMWLHHMVLLDQGTNTVDSTCKGNSFSLPHFAVGGSPDNTERIFASGNERTQFTPTDTAGYGYKVNAGDKFHLLVDLMNMNTTAKSVYLTMEYDYAPANTGTKPMRPIWLDVAQCGTSEVPARTGAYTITSNPVTPGVAGKIVTGVGHLHDGGTNVQFLKSGTQFCDSITKYGTKPDFIEPGGMDPGDGMDHGGGGMSHISEQSKCQNAGTLTATDSLVIKANYNDALHSQMTHDGRLHQVMGIGLMYVGQG